VATLPDFLGQCDVVSVHIPLSEATRHFLSTEEFGMFKKGGKLVNTARGPVVDEDALVEALKSGYLAGASLDVFENEPKVHPWLLEADNVLLTPHHGVSNRLSIWLPLYMSADKDDYRSLSPMARGPMSCAK
jgi:glyoxylate reductase